MENNKLETIKHVFDQDSVKKRFFDMLGNKAPGFIVSVINATSNNEMLKSADRDSILFAAATAATVDLPINPNLGFAAIVPYHDNKTKTVKAQFQIMAKGFKQLALRSGQFLLCNETEIYEGQLVEENPLTGYKFDFTKKLSDKIIGYASYFKLINGFESTFYMPIEKLVAHGKKYSQSFKKGYGQWVDDFDSMARKTVTKLNLSKNAPLSIEMQKAVMTDQAVINDWDGNNLSYVDSDLPKVENVVEEKELNRVKTHIEKSDTLKKLEEVKGFVEGLEEDHEIKVLYNEKYNKLDDF